MYADEKNIGREYFECTKIVNCNKNFHLHRTYELVYVETGAIIIESNCGKETVNAGEYALIWANVLHSFRTVEHSVAYYCMFSGDLIRPFVKYTKGKAVETVKFTCKESVHNFAKQELFGKSGKIEWYTRKALLYAIIGEYRKSVKLSTPKGGNNDVAIRVLHYLEEHYTENITLDDVAKAIGYEKHYVSRCLHKWTSMNFTKILNWYIVEAATDLLQNTDHSVAYIAMNSGFQSIRNFNRVFLDLTERTPLEAANCVPKRAKRTEGDTEK